MSLERSCRSPWSIYVIEVSRAFTLKTHNRNGINVQPCLLLAISNVNAPIYKLLKKKNHTCLTSLFKGGIFNKNILLCLIISNVY